jgi:predicted DNA-binding transcriptional regulator AlpA
MPNDQIRIPTTGFLRLPQILAIFPIGKSSWWRGVKEGRYPKPVKIAPRTSAWRAREIADMMDSLGETEKLQTKDGGGK